MKNRKLIFFIIISAFLLLIGGCVNSEDNSGNNSQVQEVLNKETKDFEIKTDTGVYQGLADQNSLEIRITGIQDESLAYRVFQISDEVRPILEKLNLQKDDKVKIQYYERNVGQPVLVAIEKIGGEK